MHVACDIGRSESILCIGDLIQIQRAPWAPLPTRGRAGGPRGRFGARGVSEPCEALCGFVLCMYRFCASAAGAMGKTGAMAAASCDVFLAQDRTGTNPKQRPQTQRSKGFKLYSLAHVRKRLTVDSAIGRRRVKTRSGRRRVKTRSAAHRGLSLPYDPPRAPRLR